MRSEKEPKLNAIGAGAETPWLRDPPKESAPQAPSSEADAEVERLAQDIAEEVKETELGGRRGKEAAKIIVAGGLDEARAYVAPTAPAAHREHKTMEVQRVRIAASADPRRAVTEKVDRSAAQRVALRVVGKDEGAVSPWAAGAGAGAGAGVEIEKALLPSSHAPGARDARAAEGAALSERERERKRRGLGFAVVIVACVAGVTIATVELVRWLSGGAAQEVPAPVSPTAQERPASTATPTAAPLSSVPTSAEPGGSGEPAKPSAFGSEPAPTDVPFKAGASATQGMQAPAAPPPRIVRTGGAQVDASPAVIRPPVPGSPRVLPSAPKASRSGANSSSPPELSE